MRLQDKLIKLRSERKAILAANFKLIQFHETNETQLFDLAQDIGERSNLATQMPDKAAALAKNLDAYLTQIDAQLPSPNPDYQPTTSVGRSNRRKE